MNTAFQLPEKDYFTIKEIAVRWECDVSTVEHYIYHSKTLRPAIIDGGDDLNCGRKLTGLEININDIIPLPKYLYVDPDDFNIGCGDLRDGNKDMTCFFYNFERDKFELLEASKSIIVDNIQSYDWLDPNLRSRCDWAYVDTLYITREERDRFESEHSSSKSEPTPNRTSQPDYKELETYLLMDHWPAYQAFYLLTGCDPETSWETNNTYGLNKKGRMTLLSDGSAIEDDQYQEGYEPLAKEVKKIERIWLASEHDSSKRQRSVFISGPRNHTYPIEYFIAWAKRKRIEIPWLEWADKNDFIKSNNEELVCSDSSDRLNNDPNFQKQAESVAASFHAEKGEHPTKKVVAGIIWNESDKRLSQDTIERRIRNSWKKQGK